MRLTFKYSFLTLLVFIVLDCLWFGLFAESFYKKQLAHIGAATVNFGAVGLLYLVYVAGLLNFVIKPNLASANLKQPIGQAAIFAFVVHGVYNLNNLATLNNWPISFVLVNMAWAIVAAILTTLISLKLQRPKAT
jgi:uncharacterized membrane protein